MIEPVAPSLPEEPVALVAASPAPAGPTVVPVTDPGPDSDITDGAAPEALADSVDQRSLGIDVQAAPPEPALSFGAPQSDVPSPTSPANDALDPRKIAPYLVVAAVVVTALYLLLT